MSTSGGGVEADDGRFRRNGVRQGAAATRAGAGESGGCSVRNAVVVCPARTTGWATSQRRNGRLVVTPSTSVSTSAAASRCFFFQGEDGIRVVAVTGVQTCALPIYGGRVGAARLVQVRRMLAA